MRWEELMGIKAQRGGLKRINQGPVTERVFAAHHGSGGTVRVVLRVSFSELCSALAGWVLQIGWVGLAKCSEFVSFTECSGWVGLAKYSGRMGLANALDSPWKKSGARAQWSV